MSIPAWRDTEAWRRAVRQAGAERRVSAGEFIASNPLSCAMVRRAGCVGRGQPTVRGSPP
jgi:hypothetical protein